MFEVSLFPILIAGILNVVLGMAWYHPKVFGTAWMRDAGLSPDRVEAGKKRMPVTAFVAFLAAMLVAYVMNHFGIAWGVFDWIGGVELGIWTWLGFAMPPMLGMLLWEMKSFRYFAITSGFWLVSFVMIGIVLVVLG